MSAILELDGWTKPKVDGGQWSCDGEPEIVAALQAFTDRIGGDSPQFADPDMAIALACADRFGGEAIEVDGPEIEAGKVY